MTSVKPVPDGIPAVIPHLVIDGAADAIEFYKRAFGATEDLRLPGPNGRLMHAQIRIRGGIVMLADEFPDFGSVGPKKLKGSPVVLHLYVEDVDAFAVHAEKAGAKITMPVTDMFWGDRYGQLEDPFGHRWSIATQVRNVPASELESEMKRQMPGMSP